MHPSMEEHGMRHVSRSLTAIIGIVALLELAPLVEAAERGSGGSKSSQGSRWSGSRGSRGGSARGRSGGKSGSYRVSRGSRGRSQTRGSSTRRSRPPRADHHGGGHYRTHRVPRWSGSRSGHHGGRSHRGGYGHYGHHGYYDYYYPYTSYTSYWSPYFYWGFWPWTYAYSGSYYYPRTVYVHSEDEDPSGLEGRDWRGWAPEQESAARNSLQGGIDGGEQGDWRQTAWLFFSVDEENAGVYLNGSFVGEAREFDSRSAGLSVKAGTHRIEIVSAKNGSSSFVVRLAPGQQRLIRHRPGSAPPEAVPGGEPGSPAGSRMAPPVRAERSVRHGP